MHRRLGKWFVVIALIFSVGGHWGVLQLSAWVGMAVSFSKTHGIATALVKTFDGKNPCNLCKLVSEGRKAEQKSEAQVQLQKIDFFALNVSEFHFPPSPQIAVSNAVSFFSRTEAPPTPPPLLA